MTLHIEETVQRWEAEDTGAGTIRTFEVRDRGQLYCELCEWADEILALAITDTILGVEILVYIGIRTQSKYRVRRTD
jgi:hypothetical protein